MSKIQNKKISHLALLEWFVAWSLVFGISFSPCGYAATGEKAMVVTPDRRATQTALEILKQGGNAIDAAIAAQWVLNVVQPQTSGIGGSGYLLFYDIGTKRILFFDGSVKAPAEVTPQMFFEKKGGLLSYRDRSTGGLAVGVPGLLKLFNEVHGLYGTKKFPFPKLLDPAIQYAEAGAELSPLLADSLKDNDERLTLFEEGKAVFFAKGQLPQVREKIIQSDLAKAFKLIQAKGTHAFYEGEIAKAMVRAVRKDPVRAGFLNYRDLEHYKIAKRDPVHGNYQDYDIFTSSPPSTGGVALVRALNLLSQFGVAGLRKTAEAYHLLGEVQKLAFSSRSARADPDFFDIPLENILSQEWAKSRAATIQFDKVLPAQETEESALEEGKHSESSSILIVDTHGNIVALSATLGDAFGSAVAVPGFGFFLNNQLADFDTNPQTLEDKESANIPSGGQRPCSGAVPTFLFKEGKPSFVLNAVGNGDSAAALLNVLVHKIDLNESAEEALQAPRVLSHGKVLQMEPKLYDDAILRLKLQLLDYKLEKKEPLGIVQMIFFSDPFGKIEGESDPRGPGDAEGI